MSDHLGSILDRQNTFVLFPFLVGTSGDVVQIKICSNSFLQMKAKSARIMAHATRNIIVANFYLNNIPRRANQKREQNKGVLAIKDTAKMV
jgi:hypothetical protein